MAATDNYSLGVEAFYDHYHEPEPQVDDDSGYGSVTAHYSHDWSRLFGAVDGRVSYGSDHYSSPDGSSSGDPQLELEGRLRLGANFALGGAATLSPYVGIGTRYFRDDGKGTTTDTGYSGYDRRILQFYVPIGATYSYAYQNGWTLSPNLEYDQLIYGRVDSRLGTVSGYNNESNTQNSGYGVRGEIMVGRVEDGYSWQVGPFVRYWRIEDSNVDYNSDGSYGYEPLNERFQVGVALRALW